MQTFKNLTVAELGIESEKNLRQQKYVLNIYNLPRK